MHAVEFESSIKNGTIQIPDKFKDLQVGESYNYKHIKKFIINEKY